MNTTLEQIRSALMPYVSDKIDLAEMSEGFLSMLEDADDAARSIAESIEGVLALYATNRIPEDVLKKQLRVFLEDPTISSPVQGKARLVLFDRNISWESVVYSCTPSPSGSFSAPLPSGPGTSTHNDAKVSLVA